MFAEDIVTTDTLGRRTGPRTRHTVEETLRIVEETRARGASVATVARRQPLNKQRQQSSAGAAAVVAQLLLPCGYQW
jgi:transposase-like protein